MVICLHQFIRLPKGVRVEGVGDCSTCQTHIDNQRCKRFCPIAVKVFRVKEGQCDAKPVDTS
jgi:hypothetical protein